MDGSAAAILGATVPPRLCPNTKMRLGSMPGVTRSRTHADRASSMTSSLTVGFASLEKASGCSFGRLLQHRNAVRRNAPGNIAKNLVGSEGGVPVGVARSLEQHEGRKRPLACGHGERSVQRPLAAADYDLLFAKGRGIHVARRDVIRMLAEIEPSDLAVPVNRNARI